MNNRKFVFIKSEPLSRGMLAISINSNDEYRNSQFHKAFEVKEINQKYGHFSYHPCSTRDNGSFILSHLIVGYLNIIEIRLVEKLIECDFKYKNRAKSDSSSLQLTIKGRLQDFFNISTIDDYINTINQMIKSGIEIEDINFEKVYPMHNLFWVNLDQDKNFRTAINNLSMKFYEDGISRPGKDDSFWQICEIENFPLNFHLASCFLSILTDNKNHLEIIKKDKVRLIYNKHNAYSPAPIKELEIEFDREYAEVVRDKLKLNIKSVFDKSKYVFSWFLKNERLNRIL